MRRNSLRTTLGVSGLRTPYDRTITVLGFILAPLALLAVVAYLRYGRHLAVRKDSDLRRRLERHLGERMVFYVRGRGEWIGVVESVEANGVWVLRDRGFKEWIPFPTITRHREATKND